MPVLWAICSCVILKWWLRRSYARARRIASAVLATDISPALLEYAAREARRAGFANVSTQEMDGEHLGVEPGSFDAVISRVGLIYLPDQQAALTGFRKALRDGGRVAAIVYSTPERNRFFSIPVSIIRRRANLPPPLPGQPGPFSLGAAGALQRAYEQAGFRDVEVRVVDAPLQLASAAECVRFEQESFGALHQMLSGLDAAGREAAWAEIESELSQFDGVIGPSAVRSRIKRHTVRHVFCDKFEDFLALLDRLGIVLARRPARQNGVHAIGNQKVDVPAKGVEIDDALLIEGCRNDGYDAFESRYCHAQSPFSWISGREV